jgi:hypothetical protein
VFADVTRAAKYYSGYRSVSLLPKQFMVKEVSYRELVDMASRSVSDCLATGGYPFNCYAGVED